MPLLAGGFLAGCGKENAYCTDRSGRVVDNRECDDEYHSGYYGGHYWAFTGGRKYGKGQTVDAGSQQIAAADRAALGQKGVDLPGIRVVRQGARVEFSRRPTGTPDAPPTRPDAH